MKEKILIILLVVQFTIPIENLRIFADENYATRIEAIEGLMDAIFEDYGYTNNLDDYTDISDLEGEEKYAISTAIENNIIQGYEDNTIRPQNNIACGEYAVMIYRCADLLSEKPKLVDFTVDYPDISDWNRNEIQYCFEHGFMMGNGNSFGANNYLTKTQVEIIKERLVGGLTKVETYTLLALNGASPLNMSKVIDSVYREDFIPLNVMDSGLCDRVSDMDLNVLVRRVQFYMDLKHNFDYKNYLSQEDITLLKDKLKRASWMFDRFFDSSISGNSDLSYSFIDENIKNKVKKEAFFVTAPQNCFSVNNILGCFARVNGYLYFIYYEGEEATLPKGIELNKWYRVATNLLIKNGATPSSGSFSSVSEDSSNIEPVPEDFFVQ